jgi:acyl-CoA thioester hydrolase
MHIFRKKLEIRWSDIDANSHVTHTSYAQFATHTRVEWMRSIGCSMSDLIAKGFTGVLLKEETEYYREVFLGEHVSVELFMLGESLDHSKWKFLHNIYNSKHKLAAKHTVYGAWISAKTRKICPPPDDLIQLINDLPKSKDFTVL